MKRTLTFVYLVFFVILMANLFYYKSLYNKQISYTISLLNRQVQIVGISVDNTNNLFLSDLNQISFSEDLELFFSNQENQYRAIEKMKLFFSKYQDFVTGIKLYDNNRNEFSLKKDEITDDWLEQPFKLHVQGEIFPTENLVLNNKKFEYYLPVINDNVTIGNIVVTVDYNKYFSVVFSVYNLEDYQWQWVISDSGEIIFDNNENSLEYTGIERIKTDIANGISENIIHKSIINGKKREIISTYYSTRLLQRELGLVFSAPMDFIQKYIIKNSLCIILVTLFLILVIIYVFRRYLKSFKYEMSPVDASEKMLFTLIEDMPVGVVIHNKNRKIIKANKVVASQYSFSNEDEMIGKYFPESSNFGENEYFSKSLGSTFNPDQLIKIIKENEEIILYRNVIPVVFLGEEAVMEILIDVTVLETARKLESKANISKSEFLARMSYEIRTPLNGIIGMTDVLAYFDLSPEVKEIVSLLRRSTEALVNIINDLLDFSKIETGKMILEEVPFTLREEVDRCVNMARTYITSADLKLEATVEENVPGSLIGDPVRLRQILTNLLNHSIKSTEKGVISLKCYLRSYNNKVVKLGFEVADTGTIFDEVELKKIFGNYVNIESKAIKTNDESGFGTILARQLVELMGGELSAESPSGIAGEKGTKVNFTVIAYSNDKHVKDLPLEKITSFESIKTLVITGTQSRDEEILGALHKLGLSLSITTFQKSTITQIKANLEFQEDKYSLIVILDDNEFSGFDAAKIIWENNLSSHFIMLMISTNDKKRNYMKCITMGIDNYLIKPFATSELQNIIQNSFPFVKKINSSKEIGKLKSDIKVLVVEDNKTNQKVIATMLKSLGYSFDLADDGTSGYELVKNNRYDIILMDLIMPELDGYQAAQKIHEIDKKVLIVAFSADNVPESKRKAELMGIKEFLSKPVRMDELKKLFAKYFKRD